MPAKDDKLRHRELVYRLRDQQSQKAGEPFRLQFPNVHFPDNQDG